MNCEIENCVINQGYTERPFKPQFRVFIEGPQGSGKSSLSGFLGSELQTEFSRGFPPGQFIQQSVDNKEVCGEALRLATSPFEGVCKVFDRSPVSQFVWMARTGAKIDDCILCAENILRLLCKNSFVNVVFIETDAASCKTRQKDGLLTIDPAEISKEVATYNAFHRSLSEISIPNLSITCVQNRLSVPYKEFLSNGLNTVIRTNAFKN